MSIIIRLQGLPLEANSVDVRLYFLGLTIPDGGVYIIGGDDGAAFIEFASDEDARQAMARGVGVIKNSNIQLSLSSRSEMQSVIDSVQQKYQQNLQQQQQQNQPPNQQPQSFQQPMLLPQAPPVPWFNVAQQSVPLLPWAQPNQLPQLPPQTQPSLLQPTQTLQSHDQQLQQQTLPQQQQGHQFNRNSNRVRDLSGMRGGDDKLFADKRCVLSASNIPYRATSNDIIDFLSDFNIKEECIRRRYNQKGQPTADAKIAFPSHEAAKKALKLMNKKNLCGRPVFLKPV